MGWFRIRDIETDPVTRRRGETENVFVRPVAVSPRLFFPPVSPLLCVAGSLRFVHGVQVCQNSMS